MFLGQGVCGVLFSVLKPFLKDYICIYICWALITGAVVKLQECSFGLLKFLLLHCQKDPYVETKKFFFQFHVKTPKLLKNILSNTLHSFTQKRTQERVRHRKVASR